MHNPNPRHIAIIMDGNGRWAKKRLMPRFTGHKAGVEAVRNIVKACVERKIEVLTLFAFSSENWRRPEEEVSLLMKLFMSALDREVKRLHKNGVRLRVIGDLSAFPEKLQKQIEASHDLTKDNTLLQLNIAANYGGRWDIVQACQKLAQASVDGKISVDEIDEQQLEQHLSLAGLPEPDLFIRTGGEERISNFLLWQLAYSEFFFTKTLWPDFNIALFDEAIASFTKRQRRFGRTGEQVDSNA
ncbi:MAG: isoprenyl transferase [Chromatiales bacterium]|nr:isoprenyl transferase [Chromatiales bacterium]